MTEIHKAAVEALEAMPSNRIYGGIKSATQFKKELGEWAFNNLDALRTLKQPPSVEVTVTEFISMVEICFMSDNRAETRAAIYDAIKSNNLRITRAAATDGVKS